MTNNNNVQSNVQQDDVLDILMFLGFLRKRIKLLVIGLLIGALAGWAVSSFVIHPKYSSYVDLYITNNKKADTDSVEYNDINAAQKLASTYMVILQSNKVTKNVLAGLNTEMTSEELLGMTTFTSVQNTEVLRVSVQTKDPQLTKEICDAYMHTAQNALNSVVGAGSVKVISEPQLPEKPSSPNIPKFTAVGALLGLMLMVGLSFLSMTLNKPISDEKMLSEKYSVPVLGSIPDFFQFSKALGISKKDVKKNQKLKNKNPENEKIVTSATVLSDKTPFPIREAYNGVRSNILFSLAEMNNGIIIVTSPNANDLKTTTSINLAIAMAQIGAKVLLVDCDLRNPSIYRQFKVSNQRGISRVIMGFDRFEDSVVRDVAPGVDFLSAGPATPRPSELLGSNYMMSFLKRQAYYYDFVILDTSPLNAVSDSLAMTSVAGGIVLVARENKTTFNDLDRAIHSIKMANGQILGFILTDADSSSGGYGYGKHGYGYGYGYGESSKKKK